MLYFTSPVSNFHRNRSEFHFRRSKKIELSAIVVRQGGGGPAPAAGAVLPLDGSVLMVAWTRWGGPTGTPGPPTSFFGMLGLGGRLGFWRTTFSPSKVWHRVMGGERHLRVTLLPSTPDTTHPKQCVLLPQGRVFTLMCCPGLVCSPKISSTPNMYTP